ncbi:hypothetical protein [Caballeronia sp. INDeC2]|uniref:hypothetical protein n=1 Tax=Caballeronia sp. INDeC2 TaxID=2921747 RepID=UPI002029943D|nr:hypothetical protein [Caballeronia sp. INDeC2]
MSEPFIVVEGNLRLPARRAPTDPPLNFGFEWSPVRPRPVQSQSEFALFAARFDTAYVPALSLSDIHSPYRATSLWGIFAKEEIPRAMLRLNPGSNGRDDAGATRADPVHLAVNAPSDVRKHRFGKPAVAAVAAACSVFIVWLLFSHAPVSRSDARPASAEATVTRAQPAVPVVAPAVLTATAVSPPGRAAESARASEAAVVADSRAIAAVEPVVSEAKAASAATSPEKSRVRAVEPAQDRKQNGRVRAVLTPHIKRAALPVHATGERVAKQENRRHTRATSVDKIASQAPKVSVSMDPSTLYSMLQHSPTLDSNAASSGRGAANGAR